MDATVVNCMIAAVVVGLRKKVKIGCRVLEGVW